jgi:hypothetical protein
VHHTPATDDKKLQSNLKKLSVTTIPSIDEVCLSSLRLFFDSFISTVLGEHDLRRWFVVFLFYHFSRFMQLSSGTVIHFKTPKVQASVPANTFSVGDLSVILFCLINADLFRWLEIRRRRVSLLMRSWLAFLMFLFFCSDISDMLPSILSQLGISAFPHLQNMMAQNRGNDDGVPGNIF